MRLCEIENCWNEARVNSPLHMKDDGGSVVHLHADLCQQHDLMNDRRQLSGRRLITGEEITYPEATGQIR